MPRGERRRELGCDGEGCRDHGEAQMPGHTGPQRADFLAHGFVVGDDPPRPCQHCLALGRETLIARSAPDEQDAERLLKLPDSRRQRRLGDAAQFGCPAEVLFLRETQEVGKLIDHVVENGCGARI